MASPTETTFKYLSWILKGVTLQNNEVRSVCLHAVYKV